MPLNPSAIQTLWTAAKSQLSTLKTDYTTFQTDLQNCEANCEQFELTPEGASYVASGKWDLLCMGR
jgi:hypothetical protein